MAKENLARVLGLKESVVMTIGTVVGVGLFTCGSAPIGLTGSRIIGLTFMAFLISIWPALLYGEMSAAMPGAGGTYNFARKGLGQLSANLAGWNYIISVVAIGSGEALAFSNYITILLEQFGVDITWLDPRIIAISLIVIFLVVNYFGIKGSGKIQLLFVFFFWACAVSWFLYMIPKVHLEYFGQVAFDELPTFKEMMYIFGLVWWCYTGFETCVSMGSETRYPQYTLPRSLKISIILIFATNALFQWFLVGIVPPGQYDQLINADAPYAEGLKAAGLIGFPIILLCMAIAFGGDFSAINPSIAAPSRYLYSMAKDNAIPQIFGKIHPKYQVPHIALLFIGILNIILIASGSIVYIASISLISLAICYIIGCMSYIGLRKRFKEMKRPYKAPLGILGAVITVILYIFMLAFTEKTALITGSIICIVCAVFWFFYSRKMRSALDSEGLAGESSKVGAEEMSENTVEDTAVEPSEEEKRKMDKEYRIWMICASIICIVSIAIFIYGILVGKGILIV